MLARCLVAVNYSFAPFLFCLPFANRASVSGDLHIDFNRNHLIFPAAYLVCQVDALFIIFFLPEPAYALHITSRISCHVLHHVACALHRDWLLVLCLCSCFGYSREKSTCTRNMLSTLTRIKLWTTLRTLHARWPYPRKHFYLCLLVVHSIVMSCYLPLVISCLPYCHVKPLTHLPSKLLFGYITAFAQPLL